MGSLQDLLDRLWDDYAKINPQAPAIHGLLRERGESIVNDHIAFRTYDDPRIGLPVLAAGFERFGYTAHGAYIFPEKKLFARHWEPPRDGLPKVFISELKVGEFPEAMQQTIRRLVDQVPADLPPRGDFPVAGRPWQVSYADYELLRAHSEYAAWMAAFGFRANHFTILVNSLRTFPSLEALDTFLKDHGFALNAAGGEVKGSPEQLLEQSSTLAAPVAVEFGDGRREIPGCYYEFARRYRDRQGKLFTGFVEKSADRIFESTHKR